jgi:hypothetical protein
MSEVCVDCALLPTVVCSTYSTNIFFGLFRCRTDLHRCQAGGLANEPKSWSKSWQKNSGPGHLGNLVLGSWWPKSAGLHHRPAVDNHRTPTRNPTVIGHKSCYSSLSLRHNFDHVWLCCSCAPKDLLLSLFRSCGKASKANRTTFPLGMYLVKHRYLTEKSLGMVLIS